MTASQSKRVREPTAALPQVEGVQRDRAEQGLPTCGRVLAAPNWLMLGAHKTVQHRLIEIWQVMQQRQRPSDLMQRTLVLQCEVTWSVVNSIELLCERTQGVAAMILCRTIFERTAAIDFLANSTNPQVLRDYIDYGKVAAYEIMEDLDGPPQFLASMKPEYDAIKARLGNR